MQSFVIAIVFIYLIRLHKELFSESYWAIGDILSDIEQAPTQKSVYVRMLIVIVLGVILNLFFVPKVIIFGLTLGSFLIVWPIFLSEENIQSELIHKKFVLRSIMGLFIVITYILANLSIIIFNLGHEFLNSYLQDFNSERLINIIGDSLVWLILGYIVKSLCSLMINSLNNKVSLTNPENTTNEEDEMDTHSADVITVKRDAEESSINSQAESAATKEPEIEETNNA